ncbi:hypothetical protein B0H17DRAFT_1150196 [Mycena rosella]|uniref:Uncharacterized protein n=1 Tax=Mycena rosella TaxID=1033263 RepID=A0AAD7FPC2_MYCRO|nr:hypothetical protein B0H17DRAFT_1150196 [Mycena rosella]
MRNVDSSLSFTWDRRDDYIDVSEFPDEETLDQANFLTCYNTFLTFMEGSAGRNIFRGFATHYDRILSDPDIRTWFPAYRDTQYRDALQAAKNLLLLSNSVNSAQSMDASSGFCALEKRDRSARSPTIGMMSSTPFFASSVDEWATALLGARRLTRAGPAVISSPSPPARAFSASTISALSVCASTAVPALLSATTAMHSTSALFAATRTTELSTVLATSLRSLTRLNTPSLSQCLPVRSFLAGEDLLLYHFTMPYSDND